jgi:hypothetical protein
LNTARKRTDERQQEFGETVFHGGGFSLKAAGSLTRSGLQTLRAGAAYLLDHPLHGRNDDPPRERVIVAQLRSESRFLMPMSALFQVKLLTRP